MIMVSYSADCCEEWIAVDKAGHGSEVQKQPGTASGF